MNVGSQLAGYTDLGFIQIRNDWGQVNIQPVDSEWLDSWAFVLQLGAPSYCPVPWMVLLVDFLPLCPWTVSEPHSSLLVEPISSLSGRGEHLSCHCCDSVRQAAVRWLEHRLEVVHLSRCLGFPVGVLGAVLGH